MPLVRTLICTVGIAAISPTSLITDTMPVVSMLQSCYRAGGSSIDAASIIPLTASFMQRRCLRMTQLPVLCLLLWQAPSASAFVWQSAPTSMQHREHMQFMGHQQNVHPPEVVDRKLLQHCNSTTACLALGRTLRIAPADAGQGHGQAATRKKFWCCAASRTC